MSQPSPSFDEQPYTLDPPGTVVIVGAGLLGIEAGLYGRFLGYDVQILEQDAIGSEYVKRSSEDLPWLPNRSISPLAASAIQAQSGSATPPVPPLNFGEWLERILVPITETDLLRGRVQTQMQVTEIREVAAETDEDDEEEIPADFQLSAKTTDGKTQTYDAEAVILAVGGRGTEIRLGFAPETPYFFSIGASQTDQWEADLRTGWKEISQVFASLGGRSDLDLYRPKRV